jgi:hypothetical protein
MGKLITCFPLVWHGLHRKWHAQQFFYCCMCVHCHSNIFTEPLNRNDKGIHMQTRRLLGKIYKYAVELGLGAMICILSFKKIGSSIQKLVGGIHWRTDSMVIFMCWNLLCLKHTILFTYFSQHINLWKYTNYLFTLRSCM